MNNSIVEQRQQIQLEAVVDSTPTSACETLQGRTCRPAVERTFTPFTISFAWPGRPIRRMANSRRSFSLEVYESPRAPTPYVDQSCFSSDPNTPDNTDNTDGHPPKRASRELHNLVRRASLNGAGNGAGPAMNPQDAHPDLQLSGRIISACICIRYALGFTDGSDWVRAPFPLSES